MFELFLPLPLGEGWGEGLCGSSFAPSPNPSQREGKRSKQQRRESRSGRNALAPLLSGRCRSFAPRSPSHHIAFCLSVNATPIFSRVTLFKVPVTLRVSAA